MKPTPRLALTLLLLLGACSSPRAPEGTQTPAAPPIASKLPEEAPGSRCLPVVSKACGCVYACAPGEPTPAGTFEVRSTFWEQPLEGRIEDWCAEGACTEAFAVDLVCSGICAPRAADSTCAFQGGRCMTGRADAILDGAYRVFWSRDGEADGALVLDSARGHYHWSGAPPTAAQRSFHFVDAPQGRYTVQLKLDALGKTPADLPDGATVAVVNFDPDHVGFESANASALVEVRVDQQRRVLFMHSVVSELESWKIEYEWAQ